MLLLVKSCVLLKQKKAMLAPEDVKKSTDDFVNRFKTAAKEGMATFWSTSRNELWIKGKTSGDFLKLDDILVNCEQNSVVYKVTMVGKGSCHTKDTSGNPRRGCYYRRIKLDGGKLGDLEFLPGQR